MIKLTHREIDFCMECGVCTGSCPVSRIVPGFSPRQMIKRAMVEPEADLGLYSEFWGCLTCGRCSARCPVKIDFPEFNRQYRGKARKAGTLPLESHHGVFQAITELQTRQVSQNRRGWAEDAGSFSDKGEFFYFVGCLPFFEVAFRYLEISSIQTARSVLTLLNRIGITPVISNQERCCGHDALWSGNDQLFLKLARLNIETIKESGAKKVIFSCPEGYLTFNHYYPKYFGTLPFEVIHVAQFLVRKLDGANLSFRPVENSTITYQDPCRLGRWSGIYNEPRQLLQKLPGINMVEMERSRENALCCGTGSWIECSAYSKAMQVDRLEEASRTGAKILITACPKCRIHLTCAKRGENLNIEVKDIFTYLKDNLR